MIYIPMLKLRQAEISALKETNAFFSDRIIPLIEIIKDISPTKRTPMSTLQQINSFVDGKKAFIDYFRFSEAEYPRNSIELSKVELSLELRNQEKYEKRLDEISDFPNLIPVVSIKPEFEYYSDEIKTLLARLKNSNSSIALRIHFSLLDDYKDICEQMLGKTDYLLVDIREEDITAHYLELTECAEWNCMAVKIVLNSPRENLAFTAQYEETGITQLIDNSARDLCETFGMDGFGDYAGQPDRLPRRQQGRGASGYALVFIYRYDVNGFEVFKNANVVGTAGFDSVAIEVLNSEERLNPDGDCIAFSDIHKQQGRYKLWAFWIRVCLVRYIQQIYKYMK